MAWDRIVSLKKICLRIEGQSEDLAVLDGFESPYLDAIEISSYNSNPYGGVLHTYSGSNISDPTHYALTANSFYGSLNLIDYNNVVPMNGRLLIYNPNVGTTYCMYAQKSSDWSIGYKIGSTYKTFMTAISAQDISSTWNLGWKYGLGFLYNSDTGEYGLFQIFGGRNDVGASITFRRFLLGTAANLNNNERTNFRMVSTLVCSGNEITPPAPSYNPYAGGDFSEPSGDPTGDYDDTSDVISVPSVPSFNLGITSLINVWVPSTTDINNLAAYLWSNFDLTDPTKTLSKMFTDPLSYILSLHMLPFTVGSSTAITVTLAGLATTVSMPPATEQFHDIDCGSVTINEYWGNYLDYTYTKIVLCLPFCGQVDLDPDEVMGKTIKVKYRVDVITGAFVCFVYIDGDKVLGQYAGNCAAQIPISAADFSRLNAAVLGVAGAAASAFGSAALGGHGGMLNGASGGLISSIAANSQNAKVRAQHSGGLTGAPGFMGIQKPYLIIHRPRQSVPEDYEQFKGYPSNVTMQLSSCTGFTSVREITLNGLPFTDGELSELKSILEGGVIL